MLVESKSIRKQICLSMSLEGTLLTIESTILSKEIKENDEQTRLLDKWLNHPINIENIFRASEYGFSIDAFHRCCGGKSNTLVILYT